MARILAIDDETQILSMIRRILENDGHEVITLSDPLMIHSIELSRVDLILLDLMMPGMDGIQLCEKIRNQVDCPILFLTARAEEASIVSGLEKGADDYLLKPFGKMELQARVQAHLRREHREHVAKLSFRESYFNLTSKQLIVHEKTMQLTKGEYAICEYLAKNAGQVFSREQIFEGVFGLESDSSDNTISTHIKNIRAKMEQVNYAPIKTIWGIGYKWED